MYDGFISFHFWIHAIITYIKVFHDGTGQCSSYHQQVAGHWCSFRPEAVRLFFDYRSPSVRVLTPQQQQQQKCVHERNDDVVKTVVETRSDSLPLPNLHQLSAVISIDRIEVNKIGRIERIGWRIFDEMSVLPQFQGTNMHTKKKTATTTIKFWHKSLSSNCNSISNTTDFYPPEHL